MQLHLRPRQLWRLTNENVARQLGLNLEQTRVSCYHGLSHALIETLVGLTKLYPLKKRIYYFKEQSFYFDDAILLLAREGYQVQVLGSEVLKAPGEWAQKLAREDLCVLYTVDDPLFGELYPVADLEEVLSEKNIIKVRVSHARHFYEQPNWSSEKNEIQIFSMAPYFAFSTKGERCRVGSLVTEHLEYDAHSSLFATLNREYPSYAERESNQKLIETIEEKGLGSARSFFAKGTPRIYDRAVLYWEDMDASAFLDRLAEMWRSSSIDPDSKLSFAAETPCLSRWGSLTFSRYCEAKGLSAEATRGLVILPVQWLRLGSDLEQLWVQARESVLKDQNGE